MRKLCDEKDQSTNKVRELEASVAKLKNQIGKPRLAGPGSRTCRGADEGGWNAPEEVGGWKGIVAKGKRSVPGVGRSCSVAEPQCPHVQKKARVPTVNHHMVLHIKM